MENEDIPDNWEDEAEEVTKEEAESWKKDANYVFKSENLEDYTLSQNSSLINHDSQLHSHYKQQKEQTPKEPTQKKDEPKQKPEEIIQKLDKPSLIRKLSGQPYPSDHKSHINIVFIGHVDAGKSTICGNLVLKSNKIDKRVVEQYELEAKENNRESWWLAYIMDVNEEEREKGITIEVGRAFIETPTRIICILDAPGHKSFVPNMISGAAQADIAALVVSARPGEFESGFQKGGQTREHILLCKSMGVESFIVLVTKMDTVDWSQERFNYIKSELLPFLIENCKLSESRLHWIPISGLEGKNLTSLDYSCWYNGADFLSTLDTCPVDNREKEAPLRLQILDKTKDQGTVVLGKLESGIIVNTMEVLIMPDRTQAEIQEIMGVEDEKILFAEAGMNVRVKLKSQGEVKNGDIICDPYDLPSTTADFNADILFLDLLPHKPLIVPGYTCMIHIGVAVSQCVVQEIHCRYDPVTKKKTKASFCKSNTRARASLRLKETMCVEPYSSSKFFGRFTLRDEDTTIGLGKILDLFNNDR